MRSGSDEVEVVSVDAVDQQPVWLDVAVLTVLPAANERVVSESFRQHTPLQEQRDDFAQLCHVLAAFLREFDVAAELRAGYRDSHPIRFPGL
jgi:hypothetical protein